MTEPLLSTGIDGLDHLLRGGLPRNRLYLVEGLPGTGKTTMAVQFLIEGRARGESTLYVTLSETAKELEAVAASHGWSLDGIELMPLAGSEGWKSDEQYTLYHPSEVELGETINPVLQHVERLRPTRVVFDSLSELKLLARDPLRFRREILGLKQFFSQRDCTVLLLDDLSAGAGDLQLESIAHGVVLLEQLPFEYGRARRRLRIPKLRGAAALEGFHDFAIRRGGVVVFPQLSSTFEAPHAASSSDQVRSGVPELDELVGGGLARGSATVLIGPAGSGKSTVAAQYIAAARDRAVVFLFDEGPASFLKRSDRLGMRLSEQVAHGRIRLDVVDPGELSPGEFSYRVCDAVEREGARLVMIDSLNGYLNAIPQSNAPLVRMHELLAFLAPRGVATLLTVAQYGIVGVSMQTPIDISYMADCVVLLRFFEAFGSVRRAMSVVKKRTGPHESTIRELQLGPDAIHVGGQLTDFQGVLTGVPQYTGTTAPLLPHEQ